MENNQNISHRIFSSNFFSSNWAEMLRLFLCLSFWCAETQGDIFSPWETFLLFWELEFAN